MVIRLALKNRIKYINVIEIYAMYGSGDLVIITDVKTDRYEVEDISNIELLTGSDFVSIWDNKKKY